jgi:hypothetical protein
MKKKKRRQEEEKKYDYADNDEGSAICVHKIFISLHGWGILFELSSEFSLNSYNRCH